MAKRLKQREKKIIEFHKRFASGEQYLMLNNLGEVVEQPKLFYWQVRETYNHIEPILCVIKNKLKNNGVNYTEKEFDTYFCGENGLVSLLVPVQRAYNSLKNSKSEFINRLSLPTLIVEDGSVDIDALEEEGLGYGKVLVYRQGADRPILLEENINKFNVYDTEEERLLTEFRTLVGDIDYRAFLFELWLKGEHNDN